MKVVLLAGANCIHTIRWANGLVSRGLDVYLVSVHKLTHELDDRVTLFELKSKNYFGYFTAVFKVKAIITRIVPDIVNAHYATGYGLLARLVGFKPVILSVWGSDVYDFPNKSPLHLCFLKGNLKSATAIASTSYCMSIKVEELFRHQNIFITPFGVSEELFRPFKKPMQLKDKFIIGTVKTLKAVYGIDILIKAFSKVWSSLGKPVNLLLEISGEGEELDNLQILARDLGIFEQVSFHGQIKHCNVPQMLNRLDVYCAFSRSESFGVAVLEAFSCEKPVIVSSAEGLSEVTLNGKTGLIVPIDDVDASAEAMMTLIVDDELRIEMGKSGRRHFLENYSWKKSLDLMIQAYKKTIEIKSINGNAQ